MRKVINISLIVLLLVLQVKVVTAKVWLLPDYQRKQIYSNRVNEEITPSVDVEGEEFSCSDYEGMVPLSEIGGDMECTEYYYGIETCCSDWACKASVYSYTQANCVSAGKLPDTSQSCTNKDGTVVYKRCKCDTSKYPYTSSNCSYFLSGSTCKDAYGTHYAECINYCEKAKREGVCISSCEWGCAKSYTNCSTCCIECKTCTKKDCLSLGYETSCPEYMKCEDTCTPGCGDNTTYYKVTGTICDDVCLTSCMWGCANTHSYCGCCIECNPCPVRNCEAEGYSLECPKGSVCYDICVKGCGTTSPIYYKPTGCYMDLTNYWCKECGECPAGYFNPHTYWCKECGNS